jgi:hypothetical protein
LSVDSFSGVIFNTQNNGAVSKVIKKCISHSTRAQHALSAAETVRVSRALQQFACHAYCGATGPVSKMVSQQEKASCVLRFAMSRSVITVQREFRGTDLDKSKQVPKVKSGHSN